MVEEALKSGWETCLIGIPLIALLLIGVFRLDELILKPRKKPSRPPLPLQVLRARRQYSPQNRHGYRPRWSAW